MGKSVGTPPFDVVVVVVVEVVGVLGGIVGDEVGFDVEESVVGEVEPSVPVVEVVVLVVVVPTVVVPVVVYGVVVLNGVVVVVVVCPLVDPRRANAGARKMSRLNSMIYDTCTLYLDSKDIGRKLRGER